MYTENERIKKLRKALKLSQESFGDAIGLTKSSISNIESGFRKVTEQHIKLLVSAFNANEHWLRTGEGEMFKKTDSFSLDEYAKKSQLTELDIEIVKIYMDMDPAVRNRFMAKIKNMFVKSEEEMAATTEPTPEQIAAKEAEDYRLEVLAELKGETLPAYAERKEKSGS